MVTRYWWAFTDRELLIKYHMVSRALHQLPVRAKKHFGSSDVVKLPF